MAGGTAYFFNWERDTPGNRLRHKTAASGLPFAPSERSCGESGARPLGSTNSESTTTTKTVASLDLPIFKAAAEHLASRTLVLMYWIGGVKLRAPHLRLGVRIPPCRSSNEFPALNALRTSKMPFPEPARVPPVGEILPRIPALTDVPNRAMIPITTASIRQFRQAMSRKTGTTRTAITNPTAIFAARSAGKP